MVTNLKKKTDREEGDEKEDREVEEIQDDDDVAGCDNDIVLFIVCIVDEGIITNGCVAFWFGHIFSLDRQ